MVAAESRYIAEDAIALIEVEYAPLAAVPDAAAMAEGAALVHENLGSNVVYQKRSRSATSTPTSPRAGPGHAPRAALAAGHRRAAGDQRRRRAVRPASGRMDV